MSLYTVTTGNIINNTDVNQLVNVLQQPSGGQEIGKYMAAGNVYATNAVVSVWVSSLSRGSTPVSVSIDTSTTAPTGGLTGLGTASLSVGGFQVFSTGTTGPNLNARGGGNYTIQY